MPPVGSYTSGSIMDGAAVLLNDRLKSLFSYVVQIPYLKMACRDLESLLDENENQINLIAEYLSIVPIGQIFVTLPSDFLCPHTLQERVNGRTKNSDFSPMFEVPNVYDLRRDPVQTLIHWDYRHNCINLVGSTVEHQVRVYYWRQLPVMVDENSNLIVRSAENYLMFRTAALIAQYIGGNKDRAMSLNGDAAIYGDRLISIFVKGNQGKRIRRKPFRVGRGYGAYRVTVP